MTLLSRGKRSTSKRSLSFPVTTIDRCFLSLFDAARQAMAYGNMNDGCGTGVAFSRNPSTGENKFFGGE